MIARQGSTTQAMSLLSSFGATARSLALASKALGQNTRDRHDGHLKAWRLSSAAAANGLMASARPSPQHLTVADISAAVCEASGHLGLEQQHSKRGRRIARVPDPPARLPATALQVQPCVERPRAVRPPPGPRRLPAPPPCRFSPPEPAVCALLPDAAQVPAMTLTEMELERQRRIEENNQRMLQIGLNAAVDDLRASQAAAQPAPKPKQKRAAPTYVEVSEADLRRSGRCARALCWAQQGWPAGRRPSEPSTMRCCLAPLVPRPPVLHAVTRACVPTQHIAAAATLFIEWMSECVP